jgi:hypothetical protein
VWIEQEIAIATYIQRIEKRTLPIIAFKHESVGRERIRDLLHLLGVAQSVARTTGHSNLTVEACDCCRTKLFLSHIVSHILMPGMPNVPHFHPSNPT